MQIFEEKMSEDAYFIRKFTVVAVDRGKFSAIKYASESFSEKICIS